MKPAWFLMADGRLRPLWRFVLSIFFLASANFLAIGVIVFVGGGKNPQLVAVILHPLALVLQLLTCSWMLRALDKVPHKQLTSMGLPGGRRALLDSLFGVLLGSAMVLLTVVIIAWKGDLRISGDVHSIQTGKLLVEVLLVLSTAAMVEEVGFRGYPFQRLVESTGAGGAIAVMSALFGAVHLNNPSASTVGFLNTILIGIIFSIAYLRARSIWLPWGMHWAWNAVLGAGIGLPVSGFDMSVGIRSQATGPLWLTGGAYGPEASVACTFAVLLGLVVILLAFHRPAETSAETPDGTSADGIQSL